jgi:uncharacterized membrane protein YfcA
MLSVALILTSLALYFKPYIQNLARRKDGTDFHVHPGRLGGATVLTGAVLGVLVTFSSVGAGALGMVALVFLYPRHKTVELVGCDIVHAVPLTLVAGLGHAAMGTVNFSLLGSLLLGSVPGIWVGSHLSARIPEHVLRLLLATTLMLIGIKFMLS